MKIQQRAARSWAKTSRSAALPKWTNLVGTIILVIILGVLVSRAFIHSDSTIATVPTTFPAQVTTTAPGVTTTSSANTVSLPTSNGSSQSVPVAALNVARAAATAIYTGRISSVPRTSSAQFSTPTVVYPHPLVTSPTVAGQSGADLTFYFDVTPAAGVTPQYQTITVTNSSGSWAWTGQVG